MRRLIEREMPVAEVAYVPERLKVIHGDFHHGNFLFVDGQLNGFFDLEEFCEGYPADDIARYFVCAAEHLRWYEWRRCGRIVRQFSKAVRYLAYPCEDWLVAINGLLVRKVFMKTQDGIGPVRAVNLLFRARLYRRLREVVRSL